MSHVLLDPTKIKKSTQQSDILHIQIYHMGDISVLAMDPTKISMGCRLGFASRLKASGARRLQSRTLQ